MTKNKPKVSIGMPIYNAGRNLRESLDSLISQSFIDFEIIISDNASTDNTRDICLEYSDRKSTRLNSSHSLTLTISRMPSSP